MVVESLWKHVKRRDLAQFNRPRLDLVTHIVITNVLPRVNRTLAYIRGIRRVGRAKALASWQVDFKADWLDMSCTDEHRLVMKELKLWKTPANTKGRAERLAEIAEEEQRQSGTYHTDLQQWTCSCPAYLISRFLLCTHLVRLANTALDNKPLTSLRFFFDLQRCHHPPYYSIPGIHEFTSDTDAEDDAVEILILGPKRVSANEDARSRESSTTPSLELSQPDEAEEDNRQNRDTIVDENGDEMQNMTWTDTEDNGEDNDEPEEAPRVSPSGLGCINPHVYLNTRL